MKNFRQIAPLTFETETVFDLWKRKDRCVFHHNRQYQRPSSNSTCPQVTLAKTTTERTTQHSLFKNSRITTLNLLHTTEHDKSKKGNVDKEIVSLLDKINERSSLYTTSSCAGRVQLLGIMVDNNGKHLPHWIYQNHSGITAGILGKLHKELYNKSNNEHDNSVLPGIDEDMKSKHSVVEGELSIPQNNEQQLSEIRLICQGPILHIAAENVNVANALMQELQHAGIKQTMIRSITSVKTIISTTSTTNISALLWLKGSNWLIDLSNNDLSQPLAEKMTRTMYNSRKRFFNSVHTALNNLKI